MVQSTPTATALAQDMNESRVEALRALVSSLSAGPSQEQQKLSSEQVEKLSERLDQILGPSDFGPPPKRDDRGELLNEEGLPIIDVTEPVDGDKSASYHGSADTDDTIDTTCDPPPLSALSPSQREQRRRERERILDLLEAEETAQAKRDVEREKQERREALESRKEMAKREMVRLKASKEMQRRMGKALLKDMAVEDRPAEGQGAGRSAQGQKVQDAAPSKKSVSFALVPDADGAKQNDVLGQERPDSGDVSLAPLRHGARRPLLSKTAIDNLPLKMDVVERVPGGELNLQHEQSRDSDDESEPDVPRDSDSDEGHHPFENESGEESDDRQDDDLDLGEDFDLSTAQHQREIALEYNRLRGTIGAEAAKAMTSHTHNEGDDEWDKPEVPLEATLSSKPPKPPISRFKATRQFAYNVPRSRTSTSIGASVLPAEQSHVVKKAIRTGKLERGNLVGGDEGDSASDENEDDRLRAQETLELLKSGRVINLGPESPSEGLNMASTTVTERKITSNPEQTNKINTSDEISSNSVGASRQSKFKASRASTRPTSDLPPTTKAPAQTASDTDPPEVGTSKSTSVLPGRISGLGSSSRTIVSTRSEGKGISDEPKVPFRKPPTVISAPITRPDPDITSPLSFPSAAAMKSPSCPPVTVVDSPSFPPFPPVTVIDSPSFPLPTIIDSPSFPIHTVIDSPSFPQVISSPSFPPPGRDRQKMLSQVAMAPEVRESTGRSSPNAGSVAPTGRISRFKAERLT